MYLGVACLFSSTSPNTNNTNNAWRLNSNGNINNNNCNNTNGSRPALMVRPDRLGPKPKAAPSITSKEVTSSLALKANTLRRCAPPPRRWWGAAGPVPCGTYTAHKDREARRDEQGAARMFTGVQRPVLKFSEICTFSVLYKAYLAARRGKRSRAATANYEVHLLANIVNLVYILQTKIYRPGLFRVFYVYEPKKRLVQAPAFVDKVVQHALVDNLIYERITKSFILDNYASQKGKGLHFGLDRLKGFFTEYWNKYRTAEGWVLKADVRHFFASIDHDRLKEKLKKLDLEPIVYDLLCTYIDSTDGLPLGYQTSQLFALLFLDEFDHFVKERLHIRWYGRYMDDFFLIHPDKEYLQFCLKEIRAFMAGLGLELNEKTQIFPLRNGIDFLGFHTYLTEQGKVIRKLRHSSIKHMRSKLRRWEKDYPAGLVSREVILQSWQAWDAHAAHGNTWSLRQQVRDRVQNILKEEI